MGANANGWPGAPIAAADEGKTGGLGEESNKEWRPRHPFPSAMQRVRVHSEALPPEQRLPSELIQGRLQLV